jgi:hypothetical protein
MIIGDPVPTPIAIPDKTVTPNYELRNVCNLCFLTPHALVLSPSSLHPTTHSVYDPSAIILLFLDRNSRSSPPITTTDILFTDLLRRYHCDSI